MNEAAAFDDLRPKVAALFCSGKDPGQIARELDAPVNVVLHLVGQRIEKPLVDPQEVIPMPEHQTTAARIRALIDKGLKPKQIAEETGAPITTVYSVGQKYKLKKEVQEHRAAKPAQPAPPDELKLVVPEPSDERHKIRTVAEVGGVQRKAPPISRLRSIWTRRGNVAEQQKMLADIAVNTIDRTRDQYPDDPEKAAALSVQLLATVEQLYEDLEVSS